MASPESAPLVFNFGNDFNNRPYRGRVGFFDLDFR